MNSFGPRIVVFCCNWSTCRGANPAGASGVTGKPDSRVIRAMCSGRVEPSFIFQAFAQGADGVMVTGCRAGDCHYVSGNYKAMRRVMLLQNILSQLGIEPERLKLELIPPSGAVQFQGAVDEFTSRMAELGPLH